MAASMTRTATPLQLADPQSQCEHKVTARPLSALSAASTLAPEDEDTTGAPSSGASEGITADGRAKAPQDECAEAPSGGASEGEPMDSRPEAHRAADAREEDSHAERVATKWAFLDVLAKPLRRLPSQAYWRRQRGVWPEAPGSILAAQHQVKDRDLPSDTLGRGPATTSSAPRAAAQAPKAVSLFARLRAQRREILRAEAAAATPATPKRPGAAAAPAATQPVRPAGPPPARDRMRPACAGRQIRRGVRGGLVFGATEAVPGSSARSSGNCASASDAADSRGSRSDSVADGSNMAGAAGWALLRMARRHR